MPKPKQVVVIGGGIGGLAVANILAKTGYQVTVYESRHQLGGRAGQAKAKGFVFDTGPSWYLMPEVFEHYFELLGENVADYLDLIRLDPAYQVFFEADKPVIVGASKAANRRLFEKLEPGSGAKLDKYIASSQQTYELAKQYFLYNPFTSPRSVVNKDVARHMVKFSQLATKSLHSYVKKCVTDPRLQQILEYPTVFLGASPYSAPAIFSLMSYLDFEQGVYYPQGGMYTIIEALLKIGKKLGVTYQLNSPIKRIITVGSEARGIQLADGTKIMADLVISNADLHFTETKLLPKSLQSYPAAYWQKRVAGPSALLMYLGVKGDLPQLKHHNLFFVKKWRQNFTSIFADKTWAQPASLYVCKASAVDPSVAPKGSENIFILVPAPADANISDKQLEKLANMYLDQLADEAKIPDLKERIVYKKLYGPADFTNDYNAWQGTALGPAHTLRQSAFFRPANKSKKVVNLYYVGAGTQPGIGLPMCLISAELIYKRLIDDRSAGPLKGEL